MRLAVLSDTHGRRAEMARSLPFLRALAPAQVVHLGDYSSDARYYREALDGVPVTAVSGNCDYTSEEPLERVLEVEGARLLLAHGHRYGVKEGLERLVLRAQELGCGCALFGHTHRAVVLTQGGVLLVNPGSLTLPGYGAGPGTGLALLRVEAGRVQATRIPFVPS